jgi:hypothetical protein
MAELATIATKLISAQISEMMKSVFIVLSRLAVSRRLVSEPILCQDQPILFHEISINGTEIVG